MSERTSRFFFGFFLIIFLFLEWSPGVYAIVFILLIEGLTNIRLLRLLHYIKRNQQNSPSEQDENTEYKFNYEAEQLFRFTVAFFILIGVMFFDGSLWILPWFVSLNLLLAGITGICPLVMFFRRLGFR